MIDERLDRPLEVKPDLLEDPDDLARPRRRIEVRAQQIELLRRFRESGGDKTQEEQLSALLLSINCIAAGFGTTG